MSEQIVSRRTYIHVFAALVILAGATALLSKLDLGAFNVTVALAIALVKAALVAAFFMHVRESPHLIWLVVFVAVVWLAILLILTSADYATRWWTVPPHTNSRSENRDSRSGSVVVLDYKCNLKSRTSNFES
jgi:cytochrome c oxidase subunit IV